jgi:hypothetical protein
MKQTVLIGLIIFGSCSLFGQSTEQTTLPPSWKNNIVTFSYSPVLRFMLPMTTFLDSISPPYNSEFGVIRGEFGIRGVYYQYENSGIFSLAYGRHIHERVVLAMNFTYQQVSRKWDLYVDAHSPHHFTERFHHFQLMPEIRYHYVKVRGASLFLGAGIGLNYSHHNVGRFGDVIPSRKDIGWAFQFWPFGFHGEPIENLVIRFCIGIGTRGVFEFGVGYRF